MLIKVFEVWLVMANIAFMQDTGDNTCLMRMTGYGVNHYFHERSCAEVVEEIEKQLNVYIAER